MRAIINNKSNHTNNYLIYIGLHIVIAIGLVGFKCFSFVALSKKDPPHNLMMIDDIYYFKKVLLFI